MLSPATGRAKNTFTHLGVTFYISVDNRDEATKLAHVVGLDLE